MTVSVLVPRRPDGGHRDRAWAYVRDWYRREHPGWQVVEGRHLDGPWCKALAVADALAHADGDLLVVADADVICVGLPQAVAAVRAGWPLAIPHRNVRRLSPRATTAVLAGAQLAGELVEHRRGLIGGGMVVLPRSTYERVPLDERFTGWGQEDASWGRALVILAGRPWRGHTDLWHLWHPPQARESRAVGSRAGLALYRRYRAARTADAMRALVAEIRHERVTLPNR